MTTDQFSWDKEAKTFFTEASELGWPADMDIPGTIDITSTKTGKTVTFSIVEIHREGFLYKADDLSVVIAND